MFPDLKGGSVVLEIGSHIIALFKQAVHVVSDFKQYLALVLCRFNYIGLLIILDDNGVLREILDLVQV